MRRKRPQRFTVQQRNVIRLLKQRIDAALRKMTRGARRRTMRPQDMGLSPEDKQAIATLFSDIASLPARCTKSDYLDLPARSLVVKAIDHAYGMDDWELRLEEVLLKDLIANGLEYDLLSQMPRPRVTRESSPALTPVQARAAAAQRKVKEWERKLNYAKNKLAKYRAKVKRYQKKGVVI